MTLHRRTVLAVAGGRLARSTLAEVAQRSTLERPNFRGRPVRMDAGPALALAASLSGGAGAALAADRGLAAAVLVAGLAAGAVGRYDDVAATRPGAPTAKGLRGHVLALRAGQVTSGVLKVVGIGVAGLAAAAVLPRHRTRPRLGRAVEVTLGAGVIAGTANLVNLFDLRPGRALKAGLLLAAPLAGSRVGDAVAGPVGAAVALAGDDLRERIMLGDCGANAFGAVLGVAWAARTGIAGRAALLAGLVALTLASERVSFSQIIDAHPVLRALDQLGRNRSDTTAR
jgi:UDP-N-acetylmuramyl pentapeptide phosphotransferase/UDP-N-acetylglucosamine-1-phosphate transferase